MKVKVKVAKQYHDTILQHLLVLNETICNFKDFDGNSVFGTIIGVSALDNGTQLIITDEHENIYNRNINDVQINGKFKKIES